MIYVTRWRLYLFVQKRKCFLEWKWLVTPETCDLMSRWPSGFLNAYLQLSPLIGRNVIPSVVPDAGVYVCESVCFILFLQARLAGSYLVVMNGFMTSQRAMLDNSHSVILGSCYERNTVPLIYTSLSTVIQRCIYLLFGEVFLALQTFSCLEPDYTLWWNNNRGQPIKCLTDKNTFLRTIEQSKHIFLFLHNPDRADWILFICVIMR